MNTLPIELDVTGRRVALLGGGESLVAKIERLVALQAVVVIYDCGAPLAPELVRACDVSAIPITAGEPSEAELERSWVVFAAAELGAERTRWQRWARHSGRLFCAIDDAELSTFVSPAAGEAAGFGVRIFSGGVSPGLSRRLCEAVRAALDDATLARFMHALAVKRASLPAGGRAHVMLEAIDGFTAEIRFRYPTWFS